MANEDNIVIRMAGDKIISAKRIPRVKPVMPAAAVHRVQWALEHPDEYAAHRAAARQQVDWWQAVWNYLKEVW